MTEYSNMSALSSILLVVILLGNLAVVGFSSILTVSGDGSYGGMFWVIGAGVSFVLAVAYASTRLQNNGEYLLAIALAFLTIPIAVVIVKTLVLLYSLWRWIAK